MTLSTTYAAVKMREWRKNNPGRADARERAHRLADPIKWQVKDAKTRAKVRGLEFNIRHEEIERPTYCPVIGIKLLYTSGRGNSHAPERATLDRTDSSKGYVSGNVRVISWRANKLKSDATFTEIYALYRYMEEHREF